MSLTVGALAWVPLSPIMMLSEASEAWNGFVSLFFHASHNFVSVAESFLSICALLIAGFGFGDGDACGSGCAKQKETNAMTSIAARGRCLFILDFSSISENSMNRFLGVNTHLLLLRELSCQL